MALRALVLTLLTGILSGCSPTQQPLSPPHGIVLIGLDTLRADRLSAYGHEQPTSPVLDGLAARGVLFENAMSPSAWTRPGFAVILTGRSFTRQIYQQRRLLGSLVDEFQRAGYATAAFTEGAYISRGFGFAAGFDHFWQQAGAVTKSSAESSVAETFGQAREWLLENGQEPFFLFVHTYEVHVPYVRRRFAVPLAIAACVRLAVALFGGAPEPPAWPCRPCTGSPPSGALPERVVPVNLGDTVTVALAAGRDDGPRRAQRT